MTSFLAGEQCRILYFPDWSAVTSGGESVKFLECLGKMKSVCITGPGCNFINSLIGINQFPAGVFHPDVQKITSGSHPHFFPEKFIKLISAQPGSPAKINIGKWGLKMFIDTFHCFPDSRTHDLLFRFQKILFRYFCKIIINQLPHQQCTALFIRTFQDVFHLNRCRLRRKTENLPPDSVKWLRYGEMQIKLPEFLMTAGRKLCIRRNQNTGIRRQTDRPPLIQQFRSRFGIPIKDPAGKNCFRIKPVVHIGKTTFNHGNIECFPGSRRNYKKRMI